MINSEKRVHTKGAAEMVIKRRLGNLRELISEFELEITVSLLPSEKNRADVLTRVKKNSLNYGGSSQTDCCATVVSLKELHDKHHLGVERSFYFAKKWIPVSRKIR